MLFLLSPAKTFSDDLKSSVKKVSDPQFLEQSESLINLLKDYSVSKIGQLMHISDNLSRLNYERFQVWGKNHTSANSHPALFRFYGDVYRGLKAETFTTADTEYAQNHLGILSGLYGFLRPLDLMQNYRLEMGTKLENKKGKNLYDFWSSTVTEMINNHSEDVIVNLASKEYISVINPKKLSKPMIEIVFKEKKGDKYRIVAIYAKKARGVFARWALQNQVEDLEKLKKFKEDDYCYEPSLSTDKSFVFAR